MQAAAANEKDCLGKQTFSTKKFVKKESKLTKEAASPIISTVLTSDSYLRRRS
jgi:hypothetical protein